MTRQTAQLRARFAPMYAAVIVMLFAVLATGAALTQARTQAAAMDLSAIMGSIDTGSLPVQGHVDAF
jgi:hypothetical protein